jgi:Cep192 domain 4/Bacterial Ig-like domain (group 2)
LPFIALVPALFAAQAGGTGQSRIVLTLIGSRTVAPGQSISVRVSASGGPPPQNALILGPGVIAAVVERVPSDVVIEIPKRMKLGRSTIIASAPAPGGGTIDSEPLEFDVERSDLPLRLHSQWVGPLSFDGPSPTGIPIMLSAVFADGAEPEATYSTLVAYTSTAPAVAAIDARTGLIEAFSPGRATVEAVYSVGPQNVRLPLAVVVEVPAIEPSRYTVAFGEQRIGTVSAAQQVTLTNRQSYPVKIYGIKTYGIFSQVNDCPLALEPGAACRVSITFRPAEPGPLTDHMEIQHEVTLPYSIRLTGTGIK